MAGGLVAMSLGGPLVWEDRVYSLGLWGVLAGGVDRVSFLGVVSMAVPMAPREL